MNAEEVRRVIERYINTFSEEAFEELAKELSRMHPTLQQSFMRVVLEFVKMMAEKPTHDLRNEATVKLSREIWNAMTKTPYYSEKKNKVFLPWV